MPLLALVADGLVLIILLMVSRFLTMKTLDFPALVFPLLWHCSLFLLQVESVSQLHRSGRILYLVIFILLW
jgi:hypothetical protein